MTLLIVLPRGALEGRSLPACTGAGGTVGQPERQRSSALWLPASPRVTRLVPMAWALRARAPVAARSLPRATRSAPKARALRARAPTCAPRVTAHIVSWGSGDVEEVVCCALLERLGVQGVLRAPAEGEGGVAHREDLAATASATLERSTGTVAHGKRAARERGVAAAPRSRAAGAPATRRRRAVGGACACRARSNGGEDLVVVVVVVVAATPNYLRQASPDRGKYTRLDFVWWWRISPWYRSGRVLWFCSQ